MTIIELGLDYEDFVQVFEDLNPDLNEVLISRYQPYLCEKLGREVSAFEVKNILANFFEDYRYSDIFEA